MGSDGKYTLAMAIAMDSVWAETADALEGMAHPTAVLATITSAATVYMLLWALPEPLSKGLAAILTATAMAYLGVDTVWRILDGWITLVRSVDQATTFDGIRDAGEAYGQVLGKNAARIFVMLVTAALGQTAGELAIRTSSLPGSAPAALAVEAEAGIQFSAISGVESVAMTAEGFTIALAPNAVAMSSRGNGGRRTEKHHMATLRNEKSTLRGGPWTPRFRDLFKKAGMELKDPENVVPVPGHRGPHPEQYHRIVFRELEGAMRGCRSVSQCQALLQAVLRTLAREIKQPGTELNLLVTQGTPN
ncbi:hypothetical protein KH5H1_64690 [Corallococcus caeni]|nr:hypothetical protein KH5H1_64690 [Corallococcus sp. KH5-1]